MEKKKLDFLIYPQGVLLGWAVLFSLCIWIPGLGGLAALLALGHIAFLFLNIPLAFLCLILQAKSRFRKSLTVPMVVLSFLNMLVSILDWVFFILLMQAP